MKVLFLKIDLYSSLIDSIHLFLSYNLIILLKNLGLLFELFITVIYTLNTIAQHYYKIDNNNYSLFFFLFLKPLNQLRLYINPNTSVSFSFTWSNLFLSTISTKSLITLDQLLTSIISLSNWIYIKLFINIKLLIISIILSSLI